ncbi:MAG: prefoldin subunit alpha [Candidatus Woesearchaeota archaeon]
MKEEEKKEKYIQLSIIDQQIKETQKQFESIDNHNDNIISVVEALDELKGKKEGTEILVPITSGIFLKAKLADSNNVILNVGSSVMVEKTNEKTKEILDYQVKEMEDLKKSLGERINELIEKAINLQSELQEESEE